METGTWPSHVYPLMAGRRNGKTSAQATMRSERADQPTSPTWRPPTSGTWFHHYLASRIGERRLCYTPVLCGLTSIRRSTPTTYPQAQASSFRRALHDITATGYWTNPQPSSTWSTTTDDWLTLIPEEITLAGMLASFSDFLAVSMPSTHPPLTFDCSAASPTDDTH